MTKTHSHGEKFMLAIKASENGKGAPFGAVIVKDSKIISSAYNTVSKDSDPTSHAEVNAIRIACKELETTDLSGSVLYTTCEPCPMCFSAVWWAKISLLIFGVTNNDLIHYGYRQINISCRELNKKAGYSVEIIEGFMRKDCLRLFDK